MKLDLIRINCSIIRDNNFRWPYRHIIINHQLIWLFLATIHHLLIQMNTIWFSFNLNTNNSQNSFTLQVLARTFVPTEFALSAIFEWICPEESLLRLASCNNLWTACEWANYSSLGFANICRSDRSFPDSTQCYLALYSRALWSNLPISHLQLNNCNRKLASS